MRTHPRRKNNDAPRVGHPKFHPFVGSASPVDDCYKAMRFCAKQEFFRSL
jgi:hypothetical protein